MFEYQQIIQRLRDGFTVPADYRVQQTAVVQARLRALAPVIAGLTLLWVPVDGLGLAGGELLRVLPLRIVLALSLGLLALHCHRLSSHAATTSFVWLQALAFGAMQIALDSTQGPLRDGYGLFPFVIAAQLAVFPLPWGRSLRIGASAFALLMIPLALHERSADADFLNDVWLLVLILALAAWGSHMQLRLLVDLLGAQRDASCDALTGLANRRTVESRLMAEQARGQRRHEPLTVAMLDLDHFKQVNDRWGHAAGDRVLVAMARVMQDELRGSDLGARFGGEEFLAVFAGTDGRCALHVAERIRERVARMEVPVDDQVIRVTVSIGLASLRAGEPLPALLERADAALYRAKADGRNRCVLAGDDAPDTAAGPAAGGTPGHAATQSGSPVPSARPTG